MAASFVPLSPSDDFPLMKASSLLVREKTLQLFPFACVAEPDIKRRLYPPYCNSLLLPFSLLLPVTSLPIPTISGSPFPAKEDEV